MEYVMSTKIRTTDAPTTAPEGEEVKEATETSKDLVSEIENQNKQRIEQKAKLEKDDRSQNEETFQAKTTRLSDLKQEKEKLDEEKENCKNEIREYEKTHPSIKGKELSDTEYRGRITKFADLDYKSQKAGSDIAKIKYELTNAPSEKNIPNKELVPQGEAGGVTGGDSQRLKQAICQAEGYDPNDERIKTSEAHHLIPKSQEFRNHPVLKEISINLDSASNGILLPEYNPEKLNSRTVHRGWHSIYSKVVKARLDALNDPSLTTEMKRKGVADLQKDLRALLENGTPIYKRKNFYNKSLKYSFKRHKMTDAPFRFPDNDYRTRGGGATERNIAKRLDSITEKRVSRELKNAQTVLELNFPKMKMVDISGINVDGAKNDGFWSHHGREREDYRKLMSEYSDMMRNFTNGRSFADCKINYPNAAASIFGKNPIRISERDGQIFVSNGRHRIEMAKALGITHLPVIIERPPSKY